MMYMKSFNYVVFDLGNVIVQNDMITCIKKQFGDRTLEVLKLMTPVWIEVNRGTLSVDAALHQYAEMFGRTFEEMHSIYEDMCYSIKLVPGTVDIMKELKSSGYKLYALTDNISELVEYYSANFDFIPLFDGMIVSSEVKMLKPDPQIYQKLFDTFNLNPSDGIFFDDLQVNVDGALAKGLEAYLFTDALSCQLLLQELGVI